MFFVGTGTRFKNTSQCDSYNNSKICMQGESCVDSIVKIYFREAHVRFTIDVSEINCQRNRFAQHDVVHHCPFRADNLDVHYFLSPLYVDIRDK